MDNKVMNYRIRFNVYSCCSIYCHCEFNLMTRAKGYDLKRYIVEEIKKEREGCAIDSMHIYDLEVTVQNVIWNDGWEIVQNN